MKEKSRISARERIAPEERRYSESSARRPRIGADVSTALLVSRALGSLPSRTRTRGLPTLPKALSTSVSTAAKTGVPAPGASRLTSAIMLAWGQEPTSQGPVDASAVAIAAAVQALIEQADHEAAHGPEALRPASRRWADNLSSHRMELITWLVSLVGAHVDPDTSVDTALTLAAAESLDGQALIWSAITAETHRHHGLVRERARRIAANLPDRSIEELVGYGWEGLRTALRYYDPMVSAFSTYATFRIDGRIRDGVRAENPIPKRLTTVVNKHARIVEELTQTLGRPPHLDEVAQSMGELASYLHLMPRLTSTASLQELSSSADDERRELSCLIDTHDTAEEALDRALEGAVESALLSLGSDALLARRLWLDDVPASKVRAELGLDSRGFSQAQERVKTALMEALAEWKSSY